MEKRGVISIESRINMLILLVSSSSSSCFSAYSMSITMDKPACLLVFLFCFVLFCFFKPLSEEMHICVRKMNLNATSLVWTQKPHKLKTGETTTLVFDGQTCISSKFPSLAKRRVY